MRSFLPSNAQNLFGLLKTVLTSKDAAAYSALAQSVLGVALSPVDVVLSRFEQARYRTAGDPEKPLVFVCGPPRSGTTLTQQVLLKCCDLAYFNNLTAVFPRSPVVANQWFGSAHRAPRIDLSSFYGRTRSLSGPNDALHLWDRWVGPDRDRFPERLLTEDSAEDMRRFFGAWQALSGRGILTKNNRLNGFAHLVAEVLPNALFICLDRQPLHLAQSLFVARERITCDLGVPYGAIGPAFDARRVPDDPVEDVCRQVEYYGQLADRQQSTVGQDRFWRVSYEAFCRDPAILIERTAKWAGVQPRGDAIRTLPELHASTRTRVAPEILARMERILNDMHLPPAPAYDPSRNPAR